MKAEQLKLYNKYKDINNPDKELIFIGVDNENNYCFLFKDKNEKYNETYFSELELYGFNPNKIVEDLNLEKSFNFNGFEYIKDYIWEIFSKQQIEKYFQPILKDKLNKIINR